MTKKVASPAAGVVASPHRTASVVLVRNLLSYARSIGLDAERLERGLSLAPGLLEDRDARVPEVVLQHLWAALAEASGDRALGLHLAQRSELGNYEVLDYAIFFSATVREAIERMTRFHRLLSDALRLELVSEGSVSRLTHRVRGTHPHQQDALLALICERLRDASGRRLVVREVSFEHSPHAERELEQQFFRSPVWFGRAHSELVFASSDLELPTAAARPKLAELLDRYASDLLARLPASASYVDHVRRAIGRVMQRRPPTLALIARELHASPRTVQRRLAEAGTSHKRLLDEVRAELALSYLESPSVSVTEVAFLLGYQDVSGFRRAFKKWTGKSPSLARAS